MFDILLWNTGEALNNVLIIFHIITVKGNRMFKDKKEHKKHSVLFTIQTFLKPCKVEHVVQPKSGNIKKLKILTTELNGHLFIIFYHRHILW